MVKISFNMHGYVFEIGLSSIQRAYELSSKALGDQQTKILEEIARIKCGEVEDLYDPENGEYSNETMLQFEFEGIEGSLQILRQSTVAMIYHHWEKSVLVWAQKFRKNGGSQHLQYIEFCKSNGLSLDECKLEQVRCLVNLIKHGQGDGNWGERLWALRKDMFDKYDEEEPVYDFLVLTENHVSEVIALFREFGPTARSNFSPIANA